MLPARWSWGPPGKAGPAGWGRAAGDAGVALSSARGASCGQQEQRTCSSVSGSGQPAHVGVDRRPCRCKRAATLQQSSRRRRSMERASLLMRQRRTCGAWPLMTPASGCLISTSRASLVSAALKSLRSREAGAPSCCSAPFGQDVIHLIAGDSYMRGQPVESKVQIGGLHR